MTEMAHTLRKNFSPRLQWLRDALHKCSGPTRHRLVLAAREIIQACASCASVAVRLEMACIVAQSCTAARLEDVALFLWGGARNQRFTFDPARLAACLKRRSTPVKPSSAC